MNKTIKIIICIFMIFVLLGVIIDLIAPTNESVDKINIPVEREPIPLSDRDVAKYNFRGVTTNYIGEYFEAPDGYKYLIITYRIKNDGYDIISTSGFYWEYFANGIVYDYDSVSFDESINHMSVDILNGGDITNNIVFLIPDDVTSGKFYYTKWDYNLYRDKTLPVREFEYK